jgi:uncharacterized protein YggE
MRVIGLALALFLCGCSAAVLQEPAPSITVTGTASASGVPDTAEVTAGVVTQAPTAAQALAQNSATMDVVLRAVSGLGIASRDVRTSGVNVMPQRAQPQPGRPIAPDIVGYEVHNQIHVKVRDLKLVGRLLDVLVAQGANMLGGMALSIADPAPLLTEARARAIADARRKAEAYAMAAGARVGKVIFIRDATAGPPRPMMGRVLAAQAAVPIAPGEQELEVNVSVTYGIE